MSTAKKASIPTVPLGLDPELRRFLDTVRTYIISRDGQTAATRGDDNTLITKSDLRDILPGLVGMLGVTQGSGEGVASTTYFPSGW